MGSAPVACARRQAGDLPQPDAYLLRAERLGLAPYDCVLVEDAPAGILSGLAAGCQVIAVNAPKLEQVDLLRRGNYSEASRLISSSDRLKLGTNTSIK